MDAQLNENIQDQEEKQKKAKKYATIRNKLFLLDIVATGLILALFLASGASYKLSQFIGGIIPNYWAKNAIYVVISFLVYSIIYVPYSYYSSYLLEHRFGLSNQSKKAWLWDYTKGVLLNLVIFVIIMEAVYGVLRFVPNLWWLWAGIFWILFSLILGKLTPVLILPLFYKIERLENESLVNRLIQLAENAKVKVLGVFEMDMSKKTKKANAMFAGLGSTKRIILGDTLIKHYGDDEIEVILAHELGHYRYRHIWILMVFGSITSFLGLYIASHVIRTGVAYFGFNGVSDIAGFPLFALSMFAFFMITTPLVNAFSRRLERDADRFAIRNTKNPEAFISSMNKLADQNLADRTPNPVIEFLLYSHPSIGKRIRMAEKFQKKLISSLEVG